MLENPQQLLIFIHLFFKINVLVNHIFGSEDGNKPSHNECYEVYI